MPHKIEGLRVPDWNEIKSYFSDVDVQHMLAHTGGQLNLHDCASVLQNAASIYQQVSTGKMPPQNPWGPDKINGFYTWWKSNPTCPGRSDGGPVAPIAANVAGAPAGGGTTCLQTAKTTNWFAWNNVQPPGPPTFHIVGEIQVPNPGVDVFLTERMPPGINAAIILLDLHIVQRPGLWPQIVVVKMAHFEKPGARYSEADVFLGPSLIARVPVVDIS